MQKRKRKSVAVNLLIFNVLAVILLFVTGGLVYGYNVFGYTLNGGVGNYGYNTRHYWLDSSVGSYGTTVQNAVSSWVHTTDSVGVTTPISIAKTTTKSSSYFDVYHKALPGSSTIAGTYLYVKNVGCINPNFEAPNQNYSWTEIVLNSNVFDSLAAKNGLSGNRHRQGTIAHEFGHAMGLAHSNSNKNVIMCQYGSGRKVYLPTADDLDGINALY